MQPKSMQHLSLTPSLRIMRLRIVYVSACLSSFFHFIVVEYVIVQQFPSWGTFGFCSAVVRYYEKCCHKHSHRGFTVGTQRLISLGRIWKSEIAVPVLRADLQETAKLPPVLPHGFTLPPVMHDSSTFASFPPTLGVVKCFFEEGDED